MANTGLIRRKTIGGREYETTLLHYEDAERVLIKVGNLGGFALQALDRKTMSVEAIPKLLGEALKSLKHTDVAEVRGVFMACSSVRTESGMAQLTPEIARVVWQGKIGEMYEWLAWCFWENFEGFFAETRATLQAAIDRVFEDHAAAQASSSPR